MLRPRTRNLMCMPAGAALAAEPVLAGPVDLFAKLHQGEDAAACAKNLDLIICRMYVQYEDVEERRRLGHGHRELGPMSAAEPAHTRPTLRRRECNQDAEQHIRVAHHTCPATRTRHLMAQTL